MAYMKPFADYFGNERIIMKIQTFTVGTMGTNCYFLIDENDGSCIVVDPGAEADRLYGKLSERGLTVQAIFLTHAHFDHIMALPQLREKTGAPVYVHEADEELLTDNDKNLMNRFCSAPVRNLPADRHYGEGDSIRFGTEMLRILHTPGHTPGSVCIAAGEELLTGDTLFRGGAGRYDFYKGSFSQLQSSLKRLSGLQTDYRIRPGHGASSHLFFEKETNAYLI